MGIEILGDTAQTGVEQGTLDTVGKLRVAGGPQHVGAGPHVIDHVAHLVYAPGRPPREPLFPAGHPVGEHVIAVELGKGRPGQIEVSAVAGEVIEENRQFEKLVEGHGVNLGALIGGKPFHRLPQRILAEARLVEHRERLCLEEVIAGLPIEPVEHLDVAEAAGRISHRIVAEVAFECLDDRLVACHLILGHHRSEKDRLYPAAHLLRHDAGPQQSVVAGPVDGTVNGPAGLVEQGGRIEQIAQTYHTVVIIGRLFIRNPKLLGNSVFHPQEGLCPPPPLCKGEGGLVENPGKVPLLSLHQVGQPTLRSEAIERFGRQHSAGFRRQRQQGDDETPYG